MIPWRTNYFHADLRLVDKHKLDKTIVSPLYCNVIALWRLIYQNQKVIVLFCKNGIWDSSDQSENH